jgi:hypothetical protein
MSGTKSKAGARMKRLRARKATGRAVLPIEVDLSELSDVLVDQGRLQQWDCDDREKVKDALQAAFADILKRLGG